MKNKSKIIFIVLSFLCIVKADNIYINSWVTGTGGNLRTNFDFSNICEKKIVHVDVKFYKADGTLLSNTNLNEGYTTNEQGIISLTIEPKVTKGFKMDDSYIKESGHGEISTYIDNTPSVEYPKCIIGKVRIYSTRTNNPYDGLGINYLLNNGNRF